MTPRIRRSATQEGAQAAVQVLARAFQDNPLGVAVIGPSPARRLRCNRAGFAALLASSRRHGLQLFAEEGETLLGVLTAAGPDQNPLPPPPLGVQLRTLVAQGLRVANRWSQIAQQLHSLHPTDPHWFVSILGVDPPAQGRGVGCALLKALLEHADQGNAPTYLETDRERNVGFYEARGFRIEAQISLLDVPIWCMRRPLPPRPD